MMKVSEVKYDASYGLIEYHSNLFHRLDNERRLQTFQQKVKGMQKI